MQDEAGRLLTGRRLAAIVMLGSAALASLLGFLYSVGSADRAAQDNQPVPFSHELHAGRLGINCLYCHRYATESTTASVPSVSLCMSCHRALDATTPAMTHLVRYWDQQEPIPWVRLQRLPDFVYFTHERHMGAGMECADCHGRVERMRQTPRAPSYEMGWCMTCHRQRNASLDCWTCHK